MLQEIGNVTHPELPSEARRQRVKRFLVRAAIAVAANVVILFLLIYFGTKGSGTRQM